MDEIYDLPIIRADDYDAFRRIPTRDLPDTYNEWLKLIAERRLERGRLGFQVVEIQVNSGEFTRYLTTNGQAANLKTLADLCIEKRHGNDY
jgi:hypothetical protein